MPCAKSWGIKLVFDGSRLCFVSARSPLKCVMCWTARSGVLKEGQTDPSRVKEPGAGPIPPGRYEVSVEELQRRLDKNGNPKTAAFGSWTQSPEAWGNIRVRVFPKRGTRTWGRNGFFIHGGSTLGSVGCIDLASEADSFFEYWQDHYDEMGVRDDPIDLVVDYRGGALPSNCPG
jgi:hypothetical protein